MAEPVVYTAFFIFSAITLLAALGVVISRNLLHSALLLVLSFFSVAGLYILLEAEFLAAIQVLIYVGAISVLYLFALMVTKRITGEGIRQHNAQVGPALLMTLLLFAGILAPVALGANWHNSSLPPPPDAIPMLGEGFMTHYVLPFELMGVILLVALVGAIILARET